MRVAQEEVFGPVLALMVAEDFDDALRIANDVRFGLSASIVSKDLTRVHKFINRIEAGLITVNLPTAGVEYQLPFGGTKESSYGMREQGPQALDFYSEIAHRLLEIHTIDTEKGDGRKGDGEIQFTASRVSPFRDPSRLRHSIHAPMIAADDVFRALNRDTWSKH